MLRVLDDLRRELVFARPPRRIVSLVPSETRNLVALSAGERLAGRTRYCEDALEVPEVGGTKDVDVAAVARLSPDLVLANQEENSRQHLETLARAGVPVLISFPRSVAEGVAHLARLARILEVDARRLLKQLREATAEEERPARPLRVFMPIWREPLMTVNGETFTSDALRLAGCENVFARRERRYPLRADLGDSPPSPAGERDTRYPRVTLAEVAAAAPEVVLLPDEPHPFGEDDARAFREALPAATVAFCGGKDCMWPGAQSLEGIPRLRALVRTLR